MSRELKFRIWNIVLKKYVCPNVVEQKDGLWLNLGNEDNLYEFEQYTGLKDKNGKEIYEGDILEEDYENEVGDNCKFIYLVYWDKELLGLQIRDKFGDVYCIDDKVDYKVIGNIHENPELLGGKE
jgi:uncharacterized phage protein (TIGR01671 family)